MKTINDLQSYEATTLGGVIQAATADLSLALPYAEVFNRLNADGYAENMDALLSSLYGDRYLRTVFPSDDITAVNAVAQIRCYLFSKADYFAKCFMYIDAEYNPVENYMGEESETTTVDGGARHNAHMETYGEDRTTRVNGAKSEIDTIGQRDTTDTVGQRQTTNIVGERSSSDVWGETETTETPADYTETMKFASDTTTRSTAPMDTSTFHNREKEEHVRGANGDSRQMEHDSDRVLTDAEHTDTHSSASATDTSTVGQTTDRHITAQATDMKSISASTDTDTRAARSDSGTSDASAFHDVTTREFERHGNIGILSAGELMMKDSDFWRAFNWLRDTAHDVANIISSGVWAL